MCTSLMLQLDSMKIGTNEFILFILLVEVTYDLPPSDRTRSLVSTLGEIFDILYFIGENPVTKDYVHDYTMWIGRDYWMRRKTSNHCFQGCLTRWRNKLNHDVGRILRTEGTISFFQRKTSIVDVLNIQENETLDALYKRIEEQFIRLLLRFLNRLPDVIFKYIIEGSYKDFSERATMCLKFLCRLNLIDAKVQWSETNIISFITREATGVPSQVDVVAAPDGATALVLDHIIEVTSGESGSQTQTITDDYGSEIVHRIAAGILALFNASRLTIGISGEGQGNQTIISSGDNSGIIIALIAASITSLIIALPPTTGVTGDEQGSQTFISMETFNDDYNQDIVFGVAARLAALILHLPLAIALAGDEQGSQAFITRETLTGVTGDKMREFCLRIALGIVALITASPPTVGVTGEDEQGSGSQTSTTSETLTDDYRRGNNDARVAAHIASLIITLPLTIELPNDEGDQGSQRETLTQEKVLHVLFIKLLSNSCWTSSRVGDEKANDIRRHVFQLMQDYSSQLQSSRSRRGTTTSDSQQLHYNN
ncbi:hypothetical protein Scep_010446 [Stephania cephalantha]|uniref:Uncharacterized protein n=1 Tax=Stephania cephalantha TaxID=152367 RepID=A0AAP0JW27_9MAGN